ncbi:MAG: diacylglycerol/polyprenol kinase family protein [Planctomycetota bacterium]
MSGVLIVVIYECLSVPRPVGAGILLGIAAALVLLDLGRARSPVLQDLFRKKLRLILDEKDLRGFNSSTLYFCGCALAVTLFPKAPACAGILALALGDPLAAIVGTSVRSPRWGKVSLAGSGACFVAATLAARWYFPWPAALLGGTAAALLEAFSGSKLDNLAIPIGTALVLHGATYML